MSATEGTAALAALFNSEMGGTPLTRDQARALRWLIKQQSSVTEDIRAQLTSKDAEIARYREALEGLQRPHLIVEGDCWFSCPLAKDEDGESACCNDDAPRSCNCGADAHNAKIDALLTQPTGGE